ncbi:MAG: CHAT domain-containing protein [Deltaproteobacteria bacterium]|nr:CHAT domain-containing protein [Deltaproteobacteria bacterium]
MTTITGVGRQAEDLKENARTNMLFAYGRRGFAYHSMGRFDRALDSYQKALELAKEWGIGFPQSAFYLGVGMSLHSRKDFTAALDNLHKALDLARRQQRPDVLSNAARWIGDVLRETGKQAEAVASYREAVEQIESVRSLLSSQNGRQTYFGGWLEAYWGMTAALWQTGAHDQAFHYSERVRSRSFLDMLGTKVRLSKVRSISVEEELSLTEPNSLSGGEDEEGRYQALVEKARKQHPEQASLMSVEPLTLKQVQALLEPRQALLEYLVTPQRIYLWVLEKERVRALTIPLSQKELIAKVQALRTAISDLKPLKEYQTIARELYEQLLTPAISLVRAKELIIVPHGVLHYLPFQALYSAKGKYLVEDYSLTFVSSASLIQFTKAKRKTVGQKVLAVGNPNLGAFAVELPLAELEAREVRRLYPRSTVFVKAEATEERVKSFSPGYDVLHFATHAELSKQDPLSSAVLLTKAGDEDGKLEVKEIFGMNLNASLVVLSGCETALGELSSGDELVGLTRAFIYAGTSSVVASLWKVDDASTAHLMSSFYKNLKTMTKVEALRQAQLELIRGRASSDLLARRGIGGIGKLGDTPSAMHSAPSPLSVTTSHPYFWAPFILVGDGK